MPLAGRGVALSGDVSGDEDDEEDGEDNDEGKGDDGGDNDEDEGDDTLGAPSQKRTRTASAKANGAAAAARIPPRRSSKSSSSTSSSTPAGAGKSAALSKGKAPETGEVTPKAPSAAKGRAAAASKATAAAAAAATTATAGASGSAATKKKSASEVKGERDSLTGRRKIKIQFIEDDSRRHITFSKRKAGIMKKAYELSVLTGTQVLLLIVSQTGLVFTFTTPKLRPVVMETEGRELIQRCLSAPDD
ncbi:SRF-TF-domain-containing protein, partial [Microstroma glucosiphilum]